MEKKIVKAKKVLKDEPVAKPKVPAKKIVKTKKTERKAATITFGLHNLSVPKGSHKKRKRVGRGSGSGHGKTSTRGSKGQTSRSGPDFYLGFEGGQSPLIRKMPKRGFTSIFKKEYQIINLRDLNKVKETTITPALLEEKGLIKNKEKLVKILGEGELKAAITVSAHAFSKKASSAIKSAGGKVEIINPRTF
jgi:large subunit ribosomal protein L15